MFLRGHSINTWHFSFRGEAGTSKNYTQQFVLVISLVMVEKNVTPGGGGGLKSAEKVFYIIWMVPYHSFMPNECIYFIHLLLSFG